MIARVRIAVVVLGAFALCSAALGQQMKVEEQLEGTMPAKVESFLATPDGLHVAVVTTQADRRVVAVDGKAGPEYKWIGERRFGRR